MNILCSVQIKIIWELEIFHQFRINTCYTYLDYLEILNITM